MSAFFLRPANFSVEGDFLKRWSVIRCVEPNFINNILYNPFHFYRKFSYHDKHNHNMQTRLTPFTTYTKQNILRTLNLHYLRHLNLIRQHTILIWGVPIFKTDSNPTPQTMSHDEFLIGWVTVVAFHEAKMAPF